MLVRAETPGDVGFIDEVLTDAFGSPGDTGPPVEVALVNRLRASEVWIPQQSLVADLDGVVVGHCLCTRGQLAGLPVLALGPIGVLRSHQRHGVGTSLMHSAVDIAIGMGETLIGLVGDPRYYERFGFVAGITLGVEPPEPAWGPYFQVLALRDAPTPGTFIYPEPFMSLN
jgi:putative acetyltransferase